MQKLTPELAKAIIARAFEIYRLHDMSLMGPEHGTGIMRDALDQALVEHTAKRRLYVYCEVCQAWWPLDELEVSDGSPLERAEPASDGTEGFEFPREGQAKKEEE